MMRAFIFLTFSMLSIAIHAQEEKQIEARKIKSVHTRIEQNQKDSREISFTTTHYNRKGKETDIFLYNADSVCIKAEHFEYNKKGKLISYMTVDSVKHNTAEVRYTYDQWNRQTEKTTAEDGQITEKITVEYNNLDDKIREVVRNGKGEVKKEITFTYDSKGMLISRTTVNAAGKVIYQKNNTYDY